ncbi:MAG: hypothetical protein V2B18_07065 [Pseudomonadota bacterium]
MRKRYDAGFKAWVALEVIRHGSMTMAGLAGGYGVHPVRIMEQKNAPKKTRFVPVEP